MFKNRQFKIKLSGCSGMIVLGLLLLLGVTLITILPIFGFFGLSILLAKYDLTHLDIYGLWYKDFLYFGWFLLLLFAIVFIIDLLGLFVLATFNVDFNNGIAFVSTIIQYGLCLWIYHSFFVELFSRITVTWLGAGITIAIIYLITSAFTTTKILEEK